MPPQTKISSKPLPSVSTSLDLTEGRAREMIRTGISLVCTILSIGLHAIPCSCETRVFHSIEEAQRADPKCVDTLIIADVESFPDLCAFTELKYLQIRNHAIRSIPSNMLNCLEHLEVLSINYGLLEAFPSDIEIDGLKEINLSHNKLDSIDEPIGRLKHLRILQLDNNPLGFVNIDALLYHKELKLLSLYRNHGDPDLLDTKEQIRISEVLARCTLWFQASQPFRSPDP